MVVAAPLPNSDITECEYRKQEVEFRQVLLSKFLLAMREDLAEWISTLTFNASINQENFIDSLQNGVILCQQARRIQRFAEEYAVLNRNGHDLKIPKREVYYTEKAAYKGSFVARDNVANFIYWCRELGIPDVCLFESDDLVMHKNEKSVILTLLDVARKAFKFGVQPPEIVRFEKEIDEEIEQDKENERMGKPAPRPRNLEEDNDLDTMVRNIVNKCTCYDRFPIKKLAEGKYQFGKSSTLIFVRVMRKHVMVRVGGGWDTFEHYITKHDPCRTKIGGNIDSSGNPHQSSVPLPNSNTNSISPRRKKSAHEKRDSRLTESNASSDTWSMCSGSSEGSGSTDCCYNDRAQHRRLNRKNSGMSVGSNNGTEENIDSHQNQHFRRSIEEIDRRLRSMENHKPVLDMTIKDQSVYENKADSWLRSHLNTIKQRRQSDLEAIQQPMQPMDEFILKRGYTADNIVRRQPKKQDNSTTPKMERKARGNRVAQVRNRSNTNPQNGISHSVDQGLDKDSSQFICTSPFAVGSISPYSTSSSTSQTFHTSDYQHHHHNNRSNLETMSSTSNQSLLSSVSEPGNHQRPSANMSTQTDFAHLPTPLRKKAEKSASATASSINMATPSTSPSKIPRPTFQRSKTADSIPTSSKLKRRNSANSGNCASRNSQQYLQPHSNNKSTMPRALRDKAGHSNRPGIRREKSDVTGQRSKYRSANSPGPVRRNGSMRKEKPVKIRNGPVLTTAV